MENPFQTSSQLQRTTRFPGCSRTIRNRLSEAGLRSRNAARKPKLTEEHQLYRLAFAEENLHRDWADVIFSDESIFSSANDGPVRVFRPQGSRYDSRYVKQVPRSGRFSVAVWGWMSSRGIGMIHRIQDHLNAPQYIHILRDIMIPSVRQLHPVGIIQFQQNQSPIHKSALVQSFFAEKQDIQVVDWPPCAPDLNPIENVWAETRRTMAENWPDPEPNNADALWQIIHEAWEEVAHSENYAARLVDSLPRRMRMVVESGGFWIPY